MALLLLCRISCTNHVRNAKVLVGPPGRMAYCRYCQFPQPSPELVASKVLRPILRRSRHNDHRSIALLLYMNSCASHVRDAKVLVRSPGRVVHRQHLQRPRAPFRAKTARPMEKGAFVTKKALTQQLSTPLCCLDSKILPLFNPKWG